MKTTITGFISYKAASYPGDSEFYFHLCGMSEYGYTTVMPHSFEVEIPDSFDPRVEQVKALQAEKIKLMADFKARRTQIERKISELTAITCEVAA